MATESNVRTKADRRGYRVSKSRQQPHYDNQGKYQLVDDRNHVVLGDRYDATLEEIDAFLADKEPLPRSGR